jgi:glycosyltransferase involved in cell wall biosynthesis
MTDRLRVLVLGTVNHPHVEHLSLAMAERGFELVVGGDIEPSLPASALQAAGIELREAPRLPRRSVRGMIAHVRWVRALLRELSPDLVHAHWFPGFGLAAALAGASPLIVMAWGSDVFRANRRQELANRYVAGHADIVMTDSAALIGRLHELGAPADRTFLVNWGVDLQLFAPAPSSKSALRERLGLGSGPVILSPRSLAPVYNIPTILAAFDRVGERFPDAQLVLKHMAVRAPDLGALPHADRVRLVGHVPYEQMVDYYRAADVCVSIAWSDSSPRSAWEALACGCPLVLSDLPWVHELIEPDRHALVVPIETEAVAAAIESLLDDPVRAARMAADGRALVETHLDRDAEMDRLAQAYRRAAQGSDLSGL